MIHIAYTNLPDETAESLRGDTAAVLDGARARRAELPDVEFRVVSLEHMTAPVAAMPAHEVARPRPPKSNRFRDRCAWELERQSFQLLRRGRTVWVVAGGLEGAVFGLDEALECLTGVIWAGVHEDGVIFGPRRSLPRGVVTPSFPYRVRDGSGPTRCDESAYHVWLSRTRHSGRVYSSNGWAAMPAPERERLVASFRARGMHIIVGYHAMHYFLPETEFAKHPDWFGMRGGKRVRKAFVELPEAPHLNAELPIQPCLSNRGLVEFLSDRMAAHVREHPEIEIFSIWPHDGVNNWCQCPKCVTRSPYEMMYAVAVAVARKTPGRLPIELIAYANTLTLPRRKLPRCERIISMLCPYLRHYRHRIYDAGGPKLKMGTLYPKPDLVNPVDEREYGEIFRRFQKVWRQTGNVPGIFEYGGTKWYDETFRADRQRFLCHPRNRIRFDEARWYRDRGVAYMYMCSVFSGWPDAVQMLGAARAVWNCDESADAFEKRYYAAMAGRLGPALRRAVGRVADRLDAEVDPRAALDRLDAVLRRAPAEGWVRRFRLWVRYVRLAWASHAAWRAGDLTTAVKAERKLIAWCEASMPQVDGYHNSHVFLSYPRIHQERLQARIEGKLSHDYRL